jgi:hypothetical protein
MFSLKYSVTKEDYIAFFVHNFWEREEKRKRRRQQFVKQILIWLFVCAVFGYMFWRRGTFNNLFFIAILVFSAFSIISGLFGKTALISQATAVAENPANEILFTEQEIKINDAGIQIKHTFGQEEFYWKAIVKKEETKNHYFLYINALQAIILRKGLIKTATEKQTLERLFTKYLLLNAELGDEE